MKTTPRTRIGKRPKFRRLQIEMLEDRTLPAGIAPTYIPYAPAHHIVPAQGSATPLTGSFSPAQIATAYGISAISFNGGITGTGAGQTIAIIDAYDNPDLVSSSASNFATSDLHRFDAEYSLPEPTGFFTKVNQTGGTSYPGVDSTGGWEGEEDLDVEWAHAIAPQANIILVEATSSSGTNLYAGVQWAEQQGAVSVISMSWGGTESSGELSDDSTYFTTPSGHQGITFVASTGDTGAPSEYPAYSPNVLAVGGTSLTLNSDSTYNSEVAWSDSGGGISVDETEPSYQESVQTSGKREVPDVAFDANPNTGVAVCDAYNYGTSTPWWQFGGTSLAAPSWAGLIAIADQGRIVNGTGGTLNGATQTLPRLYSLPAGDFHDITSGSNNDYSAGPGYDLVTGRGTPIANLLVTDLASASTPISVGSFSANPATVSAGSPVTLSAANVTDTSGTIESVAVYRESNAQSGLQIGFDAFLGYATQNGNTWTLSTSTAGLSAGTTTYYAVATDSNGYTSAVSSTSVAVTVGNPATYRIATYNIEDDIGGYSTPRPGLYAVLEGVGEENLQGDAQPLDILNLEETTSNSTTVAPIVSALNSYYSGLAVYAQSSYQATQSGSDTNGNGPNALIYNTLTLRLLASVGVGTPEGATNGEYRQVVRYEFQPVADSGTTGVFYVYVSHMKSGTTSADKTDRGEEATIIRNDEATLPANAAVLYAGDLNSAPPEAEFTNFTASGQGEAYDPLNFSTSVQYYSESATDLEYRDDYQLMTSNVLNDTTGVIDYVSGTLHSFGNNGTTPSGGNVDSGSDTALNSDLVQDGGPFISASTLYADLTTGSDHLPVVADYTIVIPVATTTTLTDNGPNPSTVSQGVSFTISVSPTVPNGEPVELEDASHSNQIVGSGTISGGSATVTLSAGALSAGVHDLFAVYLGDANYAPSQSATVTQTVLSLTTTSITTHTPNPATRGQAITVDVSVTGGVPNGETVTLVDASNSNAVIGSGAVTSGAVGITVPAGTLSAGTHNIFAFYGGDASLAGSQSSTVSQTVSLITSSTTLSSSLNPSVYGQSVTLIAVVSGTGNTPTGSVTFFDGATMLGTGTLNANGGATLVISTLGAGAQNLTATYGGDSNFAGSTSALYTQTVNQIATTTTLADNGPNPSASGQAVGFTVTVSPSVPNGETVSLEDASNGNAVVGTGSLTNGSATISVANLSVGTHNLFASYGGDGNYAASYSSQSAQIVKQATTTTVTGNGPNASVVGQAVNLVVAVSPAVPNGETVSLEDASNGNAVVGTGVLSSGTVTIAVTSLSVGAHQIFAAYGGDSTYASSQSSQAAATVNVNNLVVFGDSFSDVGNLSLSDGNIETPSPPYYDGRFSNGPIWVDTLASYMGDPALQPSYAGGTDYAWGGATVAFSLGGYPPSIPEQVSQYLGNLAAANETIAPNDVFAVWAGTNDYLDTFLGSNGPTTPIDPAQSASALTNALATLVAAGAKTIIVNNLPLLGDIPYVRATDAFYQQGGALMASANVWAATFNSDLAADVGALAGARVVLVDVAGLEAQVFQNPAQYGFTNTVNAVGPFNAPYEGLITTVTVPNPQSYFFFDGVHPSTKSQQLIGETAAVDLSASVNPLWDQFNGNPQHTGVSSVAAQPMDQILWQTSLDQQGTYFWHTGEPVFTPSDTVIVPMITSTGNTFELEAFNGATGALLWTAASSYIEPSYSWLPPYQPVYDPVTDRVYFAGPGGTLYYISHPDNPGSSTPTPVQVAFYGTASYTAHASAYNGSIYIDTPLTLDNEGDVFFGFEETGSNPSGISDGGIGRVSATGAGAYVTSGAAVGGIGSPVGSGSPALGSAPAVSNDGSILYVAINDSNGPYLVGVNATTLAPEYSVELSVPNSNTGVELINQSTAAPMVAPDGTVFMGVFADNYDGSRGFMTHYSANLATEYTPGAFGWDDTASIIPTSMVPSYTGTSAYLILTKYNNYVAGETGSSGGNGVNEIAVLDPNATETDPNNDPNPSMLVMKQVMTITSPTEDSGWINSGYPDATREWCTNGTAVDPASDSVFINNEDGYSYRWDLATDTITQAVEITNGYGEPYTPTAIGPNGVVYAINGGTLFALGGYSNYTLTNVSSLTPADVGQSVTFTTTLASTNGGNVPTGSITYSYTSGVNNPLNSTPVTLGTMPLVNGQATLTTSALVPDHYHIIASYSGDATDGYAAGSTTLVQVILANPTTTLATSASTITAGQSVTFTATVNPNGIFFVPLGTVSFMDGNTLLGTVALNKLDQSTSPSSSQVASFTTSSLPVGSDSITAVYSGDLNFEGTTSNTLTQTVGTPISVTSFVVNGTAATSVAAAESGNTVTITASASLGFYVGERVTISGFAGTPAYNGVYLIATVSNGGLSFSYTDNAVTNGPADVGGTATPSLAGAQRSMVDSLIVTFNQAVTLGANAFSLSLRAFTANGVANTTEGNLTELNAPVSYDGGITWVLTFSGTGGSIDDGDYNLNLNDAMVQAVQGGGTMESDYTNNFYRLFGDISGNGQVTNAANLQFGRAFGANTTSAAYVAAFDYSNSGTIGNLANLQFARRFGSVWTNL